jgi:hypothetical protein
VRLETYSNSFVAGVIPDPSFGTPGVLFPPDGTLPQVRIVAVDGQPVPEHPGGSFVTPDVTINEGQAAQLDIVATSVPPGTVAEIQMYSEVEGQTSVQSTPLVGTFEASTATATVTIPPGFARFIIFSTW